MQARSRRVHGQYGFHEVANRLAVIGIPLWQNLDPRMTVRSNQIAGN